MKYKKQQNKKQNKRGRRLTKIHASTFMFVALGIIMINITLATILTGLITKDSSSKDSYQKIFDFSLFKKKLTPTGYAVDEFGNPIATVTIKAGEEVGRVNDYFYGVNDQMAHLSGHGKIDTNGDGVLDTLSDVDWHRKLFEESNIKHVRIWLWLNQLAPYEGIFTQGSESSWVTPASNINIIKDEIKYIRDLGGRVIIRTNYLPEWLQDRESGYCNESKWVTCPPNNLTKYSELIVNLIGNITNDGEYADIIDFEGINEPNHPSFFCNTLNYDSPIKANLISKIHNEEYIAIKSKYPEVSVGGPAIPSLREIPNILNEYLNNSGNKTDFISIHAYSREGYIETNDLSSNIEYLLEKCSIYNSNCSRIIISEWGTSIGYNMTDKNLAADTAYAYLSMLNLYPSNITSDLEEWSERTNHTSPSYPNVNFRYEIVSEPKLDNKIYIPYNVTKAFSHCHVGGNVIINSSSNNNSIKSVASLNPEDIWHITVINTETSNISVSVDVSSASIKALKDLETDEIYPIKNGIVNVGILTKYDVKHYEGITNYNPPEKEKIPTSASSSSSSGKSKTVSVNDLNIPFNENVAIETNPNKVIPTKDIFTKQSPSKTNNKNSNKKKENVYGPSQYQEDVNELDYKTRTGTLSLALSKNNYIIIIIMLLGSIICISLIISITYKKKKHESYKVKILTDWTDKARSLGYSDEKMKEMLLEKGWDRNLIGRVVKN